MVARLMGVQLGKRDVYEQPWQLGSGRSAHIRSSLPAGTPREAPDPAAVALPCGKGVWEGGHGGPPRVEGQACPEGERPAPF